MTNATVSIPVLLLWCVLCIWLGGALWHWFLMQAAKRGNRVSYEPACAWCKTNADVVLYRQVFCLRCHTNKMAEILAEPLQPESRSRGAIEHVDGSDHTAEHDA